MKKISRISKDAKALHWAVPGKDLRLDRIDCSGGDTLGVDKETAAGMLERLRADLEVLQEMLYAQHRHRLLVVLQAMDTAGKDGVIKHVFRGVNPQGVRVASFKAPTPMELDRDFLWRVHQHVPARGEIVIFNRSHYEDVLVARVHGLVSGKTWRRRYGHIRAFERMLADEGVTVLKFFLHISPDEQKERLRARLEAPDKNWKFSANDVKERALWPKYMAAYEDAVNATTTRVAPWYVVPADRKWYRDLVVSLVLVDCLKGLKMAYPRPEGLLPPSAIR